MLILSLASFIILNKDGNIQAIPFHIASLKPPTSSQILTPRLLELKYSHLSWNLVLSPASLPSCLFIYCSLIKESSSLVIPDIEIWFKQYLSCKGYSQAENSLIKEFCILWIPFHHVVILLCVYTSACPPSRQFFQGSGHRVGFTFSFVCLFL